MAAAVPAPPPQPAQLPLGGTQIFPKYRIVTYYGTAGGGPLGVLGSEPPDQIATKLDAAAAPYATPDRKVQPTMELIVTIADGSPGPDGNYSHQIDQGLAWEYLKAARAHHQLLVLDIQPGSGDFLTAVQAWEPLLNQPDVGLALDPEWRMPPGVAPGQQIGHVEAPEVNAVSDWLAGVVRAHRLPQKLFVLHQFTESMIGDIGAVVLHPELATVQHIDGFGDQANKIAKYTGLQRAAQFHLGFKVFYTEDIAPLTPADVLRLQPQPEYVSYQ